MQSIQTLYYLISVCGICGNIKFSKYFLKSRYVVLSSFLKKSLADFTQKYKLNISRRAKLFNALLSLKCLDLLLTVDTKILIILEANPKYSTYILVKEYFFNEKKAIKTKSP